MIFKLITNEINRILGANFELFLNENLSANYGITSISTTDKVLGSVMLESGTFRPLAKAQGFETSLSMYLFIPCDTATMDAVDTAVYNLISTKNGTLTSETINDGEAVVEFYDYSWQFDTPVRYSSVERINGIEYYPMSLNFEINVTQSLVFSNSSKIYVSDSPFPSGDLTKYEIPGLLSWAVSGGQSLEGYLSVNEETAKNLPAGAMTKITIDGLLEKSEKHKLLLENFRANPQKTYNVRRVLNLGDAGESVEDYLCVLEECLSNGTQTQFITFSLRFCEVPNWFGGDLNG